MSVAATSRSWWLARRDRLLGKSRFLEFAVRFPLTRPIARRRANRLFDLCAGFIYSQILLACVRLRLFDRLSGGPQDASVLARDLALPIGETRRLLRAAVALELVSERGDDQFGLGVLGSAVLGNPGLTEMIEHHGLLYADLADPVALLRRDRSSTNLSAYWPYAQSSSPASLSDDAVRSYSALMSKSQTLIVEEILDAYSFAKHRRFMDVGGGDGHFAAAVARRWQHLEVAVFDLPAVAERARARFATQRIAATAIGGDFTCDPIPDRADVITLVRVAHDHDDQRLLTLLSAVHRALPHNGTLILAEPMSGTVGGERIADAYFGFYLLAMGSGRARTTDELSNLLRRAGFTDIRTIPTRLPNLVRLMSARSG